MKIVGRIAQQTWLPLPLAAGYALWDASSHGALDLRSFIKALAGALFLLMWFSGQFYRVQKQVRDEESLQGIQAALDEIKAKLPKPTAVTAEPSVQVTKALLLESRAALTSNNRLSALLSAAVAFERSVRTAAQAAGVERAASAPVPEVLRRMENRLGEVPVENLLGLWQQRNRLVHLSEAELSRLDRAESVVDTFVAASEYLEGQARA